MKLLAWDTSSKAGAIVALEGQPDGTQPARLITEMALNVDSTHSERLLWGIHQVLEAARWKLEEVDIFGVGVGPGSFTGLRIGITTARTLAHTFQKPLVGVSSLAALARPVATHLAQTDSSAIVIAATDACKGELFALWGQAKAVVQCASPGLWKKGVSEEVLTPEKLMPALRKAVAPGRSQRSWVVVGEGRQRYLEDWQKLPKRGELKNLGMGLDHVQGRYLGLLAWETFLAEGAVSSALSVFPRYLRASDAELKLRAGILKPAPQVTE